MRVHGTRAWSANRERAGLWLLRTGVGPKRAEASLLRFLAEKQPDSILVFGYAGALSPGLPVGSVILPSRVSLMESPKPPLRKATWEIAENAGVMKRCSSTGLICATGELVTSAHIIGDPDLKRRMHEDLGAAAVDMETAVIARAAYDAGISFYCARAITDDYTDDFLKPFSYDPHAGKAARVARIARAGHWIRRFRSWRTGSALARANLKRFLDWFLSEGAMALL
jgi:nucleoside phosphorylase